MPEACPYRMAVTVIWQNAQILYVLSIVPQFKIVMCHVGTAMFALAVTAAVFLVVLVVAGSTALRYEAGRRINRLPDKFN